MSTDDADQLTCSANEQWGSHHVLSQRGLVARQGDQVQHCYLLLRGVLAQSKLIRTGARQIVGFQVAGDMCGFSAMFNDPLGCDLVALSPVSYLAFSARRLSDAAQRYSVVKQALWHEIGRDAAISSEWLANLGQRPAYQRLAHLICEIEARLSIAGLVIDGGFEWFGTQADLGAAVGLSVVHVNKTLRRLVENGILSWGRHVRVHDLAALHEIAGFDPAYLDPGRQSLGQILRSQIGDPKTVSDGETYFRRVAAPGLSQPASLYWAAG